MLAYGNKHTNSDVLHNLLLYEMDLLYSLHVHLEELKICVMRDMEQ
ncbi:hypothetical protein MKR64_01155 [Acinetobacter baumannii]